MQSSGFCRGAERLFAFRNLLAAAPASSHEPAFAARIAEIVFPGLAEWRGILWRLSIPPAVAVEIAARAEEDGDGFRGRGFQAALLASGLASQRDLYRAAADDLDLSFAATIDPDRLIVDDRAAVAILRGRTARAVVKFEGPDGVIGFLDASEPLDPAAMRRRMRAGPAARQRLCITDPELLRRALLKRLSATLSRRAIDGLASRFPDLSARRVANAWQGVLVGAGVVAGTVGAVVAPMLLFMVLHVLATVFFFACGAMRFVAACSARRPPRRSEAPLRATDMPVYSVLIALYREAEVVPDLVASLNRLVWPRDRLEIKLVCEADDHVTLAAIRAIALPQHIEVVEVPPSEPRTKPKALSYVLPTVRGELVALYDAEDDPHPLQLVAAWRCFRDGGPDLASVQAALHISNAGEGPIARSFALEYAALFRGLLPWLARYGLMLPLGGTSNHFRRGVLEEVGGWDPFNVTEDADLGLRLARFGYRTQTIPTPTFEAAPTEYGVWLPQRTRWLKGWMQTWLVHMRNPWRLAGEMGPWSFVVAQILMAGMVGSALLHPLLLGTVLLLTWALLQEGALSPAQTALLVCDLANILFGYFSFLLLGWRVLSRKERRGYWKAVLFTPLYWLMQSRAGWRALRQIARDPHRWEKTPHLRRAGSRPRASGRRFSFREEPVLLR